VFRKSIILPAFFPSSMENEKYFLNVIMAIKNYDIDLFEFYYKGNDRKTIKEYLISHDIESIYLGAMSAKQNNLNLSSLNRVLREESVQEMRKCIDDAYFYNSQSILINSGRRPCGEEDDNVAYECLKNSIIALLEYIDRESKDYKLNLTLEPGDTKVDSFSLIGTTDLAINLVRELREKFDNFGLTMDTSHLMQLGEKPIDSIKKAFPYCNHIHLANCIIRDKSHELYGDKHPEFGIEGGEISLEEANHMIKKIKKMCSKTDLILGLEIIYGVEGKKGKDEFDYFNNVIKRLNWL